MAKSKSSDAPSSDAQFAAGQIASEQAAAGQGGRGAGDIAAMTFEDAMAALEEIVDKLESGRVDLESSIALYERGAALRAHCDAKLKAATMRVEQIVRGEDGGAAGAEPSPLGDGAPAQSARQSAHGATEGG